MTEDTWARLREICRDMPEVVEATTVHHPSFKVRRNTFLIYAESNSDAEPDAAWIKSRHGEQEALVSSDPRRFFAPPYLGPKGWVAARLDAECDWDEIAEIVWDGWRLAAPKRLVRELDAEKELPLSAQRPWRTESSLCDVEMTPDESQPF